jgi:repressor LexA
LTDRQSDVYEFIRQQIQERGFGPTVREIGQHFGIRSPNGVKRHLDALESKGLVKREPFTARAIKMSGLTAEKPSVERVGQSVLLSLGGVQAKLTCDETIDLARKLRKAAATPVG